MMAEAPALTVRYGKVDREYGMRLATTPVEEDGPVWMVNLMKYREVADYGDSNGSTVSGLACTGLYSRRLPSLYHRVCFIQLASSR